MPQLPPVNPAKGDTMNELPWFRFYTDFLTNPRTTLLAFDDQRHYVAILCLKGRGDLDTYKDDPDLRLMYIAKQLGLDPLTADEARFRLAKVGLIDEDWQPRGWDKRQYVSDHSNARVKKHRAKKRLEKQKVNGVKRECNVTVTAPETDTETDTDTDTETESALRFAPKGFKPTPKAHEWAIAEGFSSTDIREQTNRFKDYEFPRPLKDFNRAWRNWMRKAKEWQADKPVQHTPAYWSKR